jgi:hypothetical protein
MKSDKSGSLAVRLLNEEVPFFGIRRCAEGPNTTLPEIKQCPGQTLFSEETD